MSGKARLILIHVLACAAFLSLPILLAPQGFGAFDLFRDNNTSRDLFGYLLTLLFFYLNYLLFIPRLYFARKYLLFFFIMLGSFALIVWLPGYVAPIRPPQGPGFGPGPPPGVLFHFAPDISHNLLRFCLAFFISMLLRTNDRWRQSQREKMSAELSFLRAQINPHFLFNTLNSIYALAIEKSDNAPEAVVRLSGMMRYITGEASRDFVPLEKELDYIRNYIELQQIRFGNTVRVEYVVEGGGQGKKISPLILIPFVENAFKYGVNPEENSDIRIAVRITEHSLALEVTNNKVHVRADREEASGLGIANTRDRLELLYPGKYALTIKENERQFFVLLTLHLA